MTMISLKSLLFFLIVLGIYYIVPRKIQWIVLLTASIAFYILSAPLYTIIYLFISIITVYYSAGWIEKKKKGYRIAYWGTILLNLGILVMLKYLSFILGNVQGLLAIFGCHIDFPAIRMVAPIGVSFYTLQMVGYLTDVYWGISSCQNHIGKLALFNLYFPQMISGPISRYGQVDTLLFAERGAQKEQISKGMFRILLGVFKKMILAEQLLLPTEMLLNVENGYGGLFLWLGIGLYVVRIYADFSGCMDIILGASDCFGISLPENFNIPFTSTNIQEFWQRWHITLGTWLKDYIMYPLLRTKAFGRFTKYLKKTWGKQAAKRIPTYLAMLVLWICMGIWHGGAWNFIAEGLWFWLVIVLGQLLHPLFSKLSSFLHMKQESRVWNSVQKFRTTVIFAIGILFFRSQSVKEALVILANALNIKKIGVSIQQIPQVLGGLDETLGTVRLVWTIGSILLGILGLFLFSQIQKRKEAFPEFWYKQKEWKRYAIIYLLVFAIIILGAYGPGYSSSEFIYGGF